MASMVNWLEKFIQNPDSIELESVSNSTGIATSEMSEIDKSIKEYILTNWVSSSLVN